MTRRIPLSDRFPEAAEEFMENLTRPGFGPDQLGVQAKDVCRWKCRVHGIVWIASPASRAQKVTRLGGCKECARERVTATKRSQTPARHLMVTERPVVVTEFIENLTSPGRGPDRLPIHSKDRVRWSCSLCGFHYESSVHARCMRKNPRCRNCNTGGYQLLEVQCAALASAMLRTPVLTGHRLGPLRPDLWLPRFEIGVDLDPEWSHRARLSGDVRKARACTSEMSAFIRVREAGLPASGDWDREVPAKATIDDWVETVTAAITALVGIPRYPLSAKRRLSVLHEAAERWAEHQTDPTPGSFRARHPEIASRFVENLTRPGIGPGAFAPSSNYDCLWRCPHGVIYKTRPQSAGLGQGTNSCPECVAIRSRTAGQRIAARNQANKGRGQPEGARIRRDAQWEAMFSALARFAAREGHASVPSNHRDGQINLGAWVSTQRSSRRNGSLLPHRAARLEGVTGWVWQTRRSPRPRETGQRSSMGVVHSGSSVPGAR